MHAAAAQGTGGPGTAASATACSGTPTAGQRHFLFEDSPFDRKKNKRLRHAPHTSSYKRLRRKKITMHHTSMKNGKRKRKGCVSKGKREQSIQISCFWSWSCYSRQTNFSAPN
jgi:hypothetical protein